MGVAERSQWALLGHDLAEKAAVRTAQEMVRVEEKRRAREREERRRRGVEDQTVMDLMTQALCRKCQSIVLAYWRTYLDQVPRKEGMEWRRHGEREWSDRGQKLELMIREEEDLMPVG